MEKMNTTPAGTIAAISNPEFAFEFEGWLMAGKPVDDGIHFHSNFIDALTAISDSGRIITPSRFRGYVRDSDNNVVYLYDFTPLVARIAERILRYGAGLLASVGNDSELLEKTVICFLSEHKELSVDEYTKVGPKSGYGEILRRTSCMLTDTSNRLCREKKVYADEIHTVHKVIFGGDIPRLRNIINRYFDSAFDTEIGAEWRLSIESKTLLIQWVDEELKNEFQTG